MRVTNPTARAFYDEELRAELATCVGCDKTDETKRWAAALQAEYEHFLALRDALERVWRAP